MRKRKYLSAFIVLLAVMLLGVGYALPSIYRQLFANTDVWVADDEVFVDKYLLLHYGSSAFTKTADSNDGDVQHVTEVTFEAGTPAEAPTACSFTVDMAAAGAFMECQNTIVNDSLYYAASLAIVVTLDGATVEADENGVYALGDYYQMTVTLDKTDLTVKTEEADVATVTVRVEMIKTPTSTIAAVSPTVTFTATAVKTS